MNEKEFERHVDSEISALRYYGLRSDVEALTIDSDIYRDVRSIGYTKRPMPLCRRCSMVSLTADEIITQSTPFEKIYQVYTWKRDNIYTALEICWILYPNRRPEILRKLTKGQYDPD